MAKKGSILVCDDEEIMRDVLETILTGARYKVDSVKTDELKIGNFIVNKFHILNFYPILYTMNTVIFQTVSVLIKF